MAMTRKRSWGDMAVNDCLIMTETPGFRAMVSVAMNRSPQLAGPRGERPGSLTNSSERSDRCESLASATLL